MPQNPELYFQRGLVYENLDLPEKALADYVGLSETGRSAHRRSQQQGRSACQTETLRRSHYVAFSELVDLDREDFLGYRNRGLCRFDMHDNFGALQDYDTALKLNPRRSIIVVSAWQRALCRWTHLDAAESDFSKAVELDPEFAKAWMNRGVVRYRRGREIIGG